MRVSKLFGKTIRGEVKDATLTSHKLLVKGGFIRESVAGRYFFLPLGMRVKNKVMGIIREEMDKAHAQEMVVPILHPLELWQETNRDNAGNFGLMMVTDRRGSKFALGGTAEEMFVDVVRKFQLSYKDLPFNIYQFSQKFRDELRARGGLLRVREFTMKDAYSFDRGAEEFKQTYELMSKTYSRIFERMGLETVKVESDNGYIGGDYCHEFIVENAAGESRYLVSEDSGYAAHEDVAEFELEPVNQEEAEREFEIVDQPAWVLSIKDMMKHYDQPAWRFLKNVVYKRVDTGEIVIVTIRGDLAVNKTKLERAIGGVEMLTEANEADLASFGSKGGFVHAWGHEGVIYVADKSLYTVKNFIGGQKEETTDSINVNYGREFRHETEADVAMAQAGMRTRAGQELAERVGIEVGNIFQLGTHYSEKMGGAVYVDEDGREKPFYMGCYGIGVGRTMATIVEQYHDERGIIWPVSVAPYRVYLIEIQNSKSKIRNENTNPKSQASKVYEKLIEIGVEVLWDDRQESPGRKFADADLIGCPVRLVVSEKTGGKVEWKRRDGEESELLSLEEVVGKLET